MHVYTLKVVTLLTIVTVLKEAVKCKENALKYAYIGHTLELGKFSLTRTYQVGKLLLTFVICIFFWEVAVLK